MDPGEIAVPHSGWDLNQLFLPLSLYLSFKEKLKPRIFVQNNVTRK